MKELDFSLATTEEIMKELGQRAKQKRKQDMQYYGDQKKFAKHIGITHRRYQQFEMNGKITLEKFIDVLRGLNVLDEIQGLLEFDEEDLFKEKNREKDRESSRSFSNKEYIKKDNKEDKIVNIPDVFG